MRSAKLLSLILSIALCATCLFACDMGGDTGGNGVPETPTGDSISKGEIIEEETKANENNSQDIIDSYPTPTEGLVYYIIVIMNRV